MTDSGAGVGDLAVTGSACLAGESPRLGIVAVSPVRPLLATKEGE